MKQYILGLDLGVQPHSWAIVPVDEKTVRRCVSEFGALTAEPGRSRKLNREKMNHEI